jgi:hypothetical protein
MITINFASRNYRLTSLIHRILLGGSALLCLTLIGMLWSAASARAELVSLNKKLKVREAAVEKVKPALLEREKLKKDLAATSGLLEARKLSWTRLLSSIEAVIPTGAALKKLEFNPANNTLLLEGAALTPEALRNLVIGMEKSACFKDPFLKNQSIEKGHISFNVVAIYRENPGAALAQGK